MSDRVYHMDDCVVSVPPGFHDRTINILEWRGASEAPIVVAVQREQLGGVAFEAYVERETKDYPTKFFGWKLDRDQEAVLESGVRVRHLAFRWKRERDVIYNHQAFVLGAGTAIMFTASARASDRDEVDRVLESMLDTLRFRED